MTTSPDFSERLKGRTCSAFNGCLLYVPGELIAAGMNTLPVPAESENFKPQRTVDIDVPNLYGMVRITFRLKKFRHYRDSYWRWSVERADLIDSPLTSEQSTG
jgi:hypothetical protein